MPTLCEKVISIAKAEVGYREEYKNGSYNNNQKYSDEVPGLEWSDYQPWCQTFQAWVAMKAGSASIEPRTASCAAAVKWFKDRNRFSYYPAIGAQVFFGAGGGSHVGRVYAYDADYIYTVEGNTNSSGSAEGNGVYLKKRARRDAYVYGYGYPAFPEGIKSADPAWADAAPIKGIDVASWQSETYSLTGADFVVVKATEGTNYVNPKYAAQVKRARDNGRVTGHYHFLRPGSMTAQVDYFLKHTDLRAGEFVALDWEDSGVTCAQKDAALKYLKSKVGTTKVLLYCNRYFWLNKDTTSYACDGLWIADYDTAPGAPRIEADWLIHQFTESPIDTNVTHWTSRAAMQTWAGPTEEDPLAGYTKQDIADAVWCTDGVHDVPARWREDNPTNEQWKAESVHAFIGDRVLDVRDEIKALSAKVASLSAPVLTDAQVSAIATKVADLLSARLAQ